MTVHPIGVHIGPGLTDDGELLDGGPLARAAEMDADGVQVFLTDPQSYKNPKPRPDEADLLATERKAEAIWRAIRTAQETGEWQPNPGRLCGWCAHKSLCPAFGGTPPPLPATAGPVAAGDDVDLD